MEVINESSGCICIINVYTSRFREPYGIYDTDGLSKCLKLKREAERNTNPDRIKWICKQVKAEIDIDSTGKLHINKLIKE